MSAAPFDLPKADRWFAVELNNRVADWVEEGVRSPAESDAMIHAAHASAWHWLQVGNVANHARAECLVANAYVEAGVGVCALRHARRSVELIELHTPEMADWDLPFAYDALARAQRLTGDELAAERFRTKARNLAEQIADPESRDAFDRWASR